MGYPTTEASFLYVEADLTKTQESARMCTTCRMYRNKAKYLERVRSLMERVLGITEARQAFSNVVERVQYQGDSYIISRHG